MVRSSGLLSGYGGDFRSHCRKRKQDFAFQPKKSKRFLRRDEEGSKRSRFCEMRSENSQDCCRIASLAAWSTGSGDESLPFFAESMFWSAFLYPHGAARRKLHWKNDPRKQGSRSGAGSNEVCHVLQES